MLNRRSLGGREMDWALLLLLTILTCGFIGYGLLGRARFYEYPFLAAAVFFSFVLPQIPGLANSRFISDEALSKTLFLTCLCLVMAGLGWRAGVRVKVFSDSSFSEARLLRCAAFLSLVGAYFFYKFGQLPDEDRLRGMHTGVSVAYLFFAKLLTYGLAIALICYAARRSKLALGIILFDLLLYVHRIIITGKRGETAELFLMIALAYWFQKRWVVPRGAVVAGVCLSVVALLGVGEYREATLYNDGPDWTAVLNIDIGRQWEGLLKEGGPEMRNAVSAIEWIDRSRAFDFGAHHWNQIVFSYVPAQLVGHDFKSSLLFDMPAIFPRGFDPGIGATWTGMADVFASFWYLGSVTFYGLAFVMGLLYRSAMEGVTVSKIIYSLSTVPSMLAITHFTSEILIAWIHILIFLVPVFYYSRINSPSRFELQQGWRTG